MSSLVWDAEGARKFETGISKGVLYRKSTESGLTKGHEWVGVAWNGLTGITETPEGAEAQDFYADNIKYASLRSAETFGGSIEAYTYPEEFEYCNGERHPVVGMSIGQQPREAFRLCYRTEQGDDSDQNAGYKIHLVYGCTASPSDRQYQSINDNPDLMSMSWDFDTIPVNMTGYKPVSLITINSMNFKTEAEKAALKALEDALYGTSSEDPYMPDPDDVVALLTVA